MLIIILNRYINEKHEIIYEEPFVYSKLQQKANVMCKCEIKNVISIKEHIEKIMLHLVNIYSFDFPTL